jgi:hypothetical protein
VQDVARCLRTFSMGATAIFDLTGTLIYVLTRRALAAPEPDRSVIEPLRLSARTISDAYREAVGGVRPTP